MLLHFMPCIFHAMRVWCHAYSMQWECDIEESFSVCCPLVTYMLKRRRLLHLRPCIFHRSDGRCVSCISCRAYFMQWKFDIEDLFSICCPLLTYMLTFHIWHPVIRSRAQRPEYWIWQPQANPQWIVAQWLLSAHTKPGFTEVICKQFSNAVQQQAWTFVGNTVWHHNAKWHSCTRICLNSTFDTLSSVPERNARNTGYGNHRQILNGS